MGTTSVLSSSIVGQLAAVLLLLIPVGMYLYTRKKYKYATVGALAQRLGLHVKQGEAGLNLYALINLRSNYKRKVELAGRPYGRDMQWSLLQSLRTKNILVMVKVTQTWGCSLSLTLDRQIPDFEVTLAKPVKHMSPDPELTDLPQVPTGDAGVDAYFRVATAVPEVVPYLVPGLRLLVGQPYARVIGRGNQVTMRIGRLGLLGFIEAAENAAFAMEVLACGLDGRRPPAAPYCAPPEPETPVRRWG